MQRKLRMRAVVAALAIAGSMATAVPAAADEIGVLSARGCTGRNGPGDINATCITVTGTGTLVQKIQGSMESVNVPIPTPITLCGVKVNVWGKLRSGAPYNHTGTAACNYYGNAYVNWAPFTNFAANSTICARTYFDNQWSNAACITIRS